MSRWPPISGEAYVLEHSNALMPSNAPPSADTVLCKQASGMAEPHAGKYTCRIHLGACYSTCELLVKGSPPFSAGLFMS